MFRTKDANGNVKYSGRSKATVVDNRDPLKKGRIIVDHPLLGETVWIDYLSEPGRYNPPSIGDLVYVEADAGHQEFPIAWGNAVKGEDSNPDVPTQFKRDVPSNRGWQTPGGHKVELDDGVATVTDAPNDKAFTTANRGIRLTTKAGNKVWIIEDTDASQGYILIEDIGGNSIKLDTINKSIEINTDGNQNNVIGGNYQIVVTGNVSIQCADAHVQASSALVETSGNTVVDAGGNVQVTGAQIQLNGSSGQVLTTVTDPVVDTIFGAPTMGVPTVKSG